LEELEMLEPLILHGASLEELFIRKNSSAYKDFYMKNYLIYSSKQIKPNLFLRQQLNNMVEEVGRFFFEKDEGAAVNTSTPLSGLE